MSPNQKRTQPLYREAREYSQSDVLCNFDFFEFKLISRRLERVKLVPVANLGRSLGSSKSEPDFGNMP
jgi:hypothetical protein